MKLTVIVLALFAIVAAIATATSAQAGEKNSTYFRQTSGLVYVGFDGPACGKFPMPNIFVDGEDNCVRVPNTYLYKLERDGQVVTREVKELTATWDSVTTTETTAVVDGVEVPVTITDTMSVTDGRSVFGSFGVRNNWSLDDLTGIFGSAESAAERARFFATGLAATRTSEGGSDYLGSAGSLLPGNDGQ